VKTCLTTTGGLGCLCCWYGTDLGFCATFFTPLFCTIWKLPLAGNGGVNVFADPLDEVTELYCVCLLFSFFLVLFAAAAASNDGGGFSWHLNWSLLGLFWMTAWQIW
jgi:hypothetical protein